MRILRIVLLIILLVMVVVVIGGFVIYRNTMNGPLPQIDGTLSVKGLDAQVEVLRDNWGIPHIYASDSHDLFFTQGYVQAQDRWWQMEFFRHTGSGTLEELTGKTSKLIGTDIFIRTVGWRRTAEKEINQMTDSERAILEAFAAGVNAYILNRSPNDLAMQYPLLSVTGVTITIDPWTPIDSLVWAKVMSWNLTDSYSYDLTRQSLLDSVGQAMTDAYNAPWPYGGDRPTILYDEDLPITDASAHAAQSGASTAPTNRPVDLVLAGNVRPGSDATFGGDRGIGSNNWVAAGTMTKDGTPLLANDPHLGIQMPSIWYEIGLHCLPVSDQCPYNVVGFGLSPTPGVVIGHNDQIAWGVTNNGADVQDLYLITINPDNPLQYRWNGEWRDMVVHDETINFGDGKAPLTIHVRETHLGPILNDNKIDDQTGEVTGYNNDDPMVLHWTGSEPSTLFDAVLQIDRATGWESFREALRSWDIPSQNFVYADIRGNIGYQMPGHIPIRPAGQNGISPVPANKDADTWTGYIPFDDLPRIFNPPRNYIVTANQAVVPMSYYDQLAAKLGSDANYLLSFDYAYGERAARITELLKQNAPNTITTYQQIQGDNKNLDAAAIVPFLANLKLDPGPAQQARDLLTGWDFQMSATSGQAALFAEFDMRLLHNLFADQLPSDVQADNHELWAVIQLLSQPDNPWWDDVTTKDVVEARDDILTRSLAEAFDAASRAMGSNQAEWQWGKLHTATFVSNPLGASGIDLIEKMVNRGPVAISGGTDSINATGWDPSSGDFTTQSLPSMRMIVDVGNFDNSLTIHTTGQSGHPASPHYDDMIDLWRSIQYHPMFWSRARIEAATADRLILTPAS